MIKIIGIGSPFGDDQVGWRVADQLKTELPHIAIEKSDRPGPRLVSLLQGADTVILIDAVMSGAAVGAIHLLDYPELPNSTYFLSSHGFGVLEGLQLAEALGILPKNLSIYGIEIAHGQSMLVNRSIGEVVCLIKNRIS